MSIVTDGDMLAEHLNLRGGIVELRSDSKGTLFKVTPSNPSNMEKIVAALGAFRTQHQELQDAADTLDRKCIQLKTAVQTKKDGLQKAASNCVYVLFHFVVMYLLFLSTPT